MTSIRFCDEALLEKLRLAPHLSKLFGSGNSDIGNTLDKDGRKGLNFDNLTTKTNLSFFKEYLEMYCSEHNGIHTNRTKIVRFLQSSEKGLPIEIIVFSKFQNAEAFESLQAEIFNHILAVLPEFELCVFQNPSGNSLQSIGDVQ